MQHMRRFLGFLAFLVLFSLACQTVMGLLPGGSLPSTTTSFTQPALESTLTSTPFPPTSTLSPSPTPSPTRVPGITTTAGSTNFSLHLHPDGPLYVGDQVSLEVIPREGLDLGDRQVVVRLKGAGDILGSAGFEPYGIGRRNQATLTWVWDTSTALPGEHTLAFSLNPGGETWTETVTLLPASQVPPPEPQASWQEIETGCCVVHFVSGTDASRDIEDLIEKAEVEAAAVQQQMGVDFEEKVQLTFLPRVLGHGGFAGDDISISYLERNYTGGSLQNVLHHEMVHLLDARLGGELRPSLFVEGLAVYMSGGHFKTEPLMERAAALLTPQPGCQPASEVLDGATSGSDNSPVCALDSYIPLQTLFDNFYLSQHEIGYLQAGALIEFMVKQWGWEAFDRFYRDIHPLVDENGVSLGQSLAVESALQAHFGLSLPELEDIYLQALRQQPLSAKWVEDVRLSVDFYNTARRYQELLDPSAYFLYAWLLDNSAMRQRGIVADYLRRPSSPENIAIEQLLVGANVALLSGEYPRVQELLVEINLQLDAGQKAGAAGE